MISLLLPILLEYSFTASFSAVPSNPKKLLISSSAFCSKHVQSEFSGCTLYSQTSLMIILKKIIMWNLKMNLIFFLHFQLFCQISMANVRNIIRHKANLFKYENLKNWHNVEFVCKADYEVHVIISCKGLKKTNSARSLEKKRALSPKKLNLLYRRTYVSYTLLC